MNSTTNKTIIFIAVIFNIAAVAAMGGIVGSAHDFSAQGWSGGEICVACHTPHNADKTLPGAPLWNHTVSVATYTLYSSPSLYSVPGQPGAHSRMCLSCHDGTVAIDSFGGNTGSELISGAALIGTDLANDHPIGMKFQHDEPGLNCLGCHQVQPWGFTKVVPFFDGKVECASCHDVHNQSAAGPKLVRKTTTGSALCLHCHAK